MASSLEINKIVGAVLTAGVVAMTAGFVAELMFPHEEHQEPVYRIAAAPEDGGAAGEAPAEAAAPGLQPVAPLMAAADPAAGESAAKKCSSCHSFDKGGPNKIGPNLWGVVDRQIAGAEGFSYSDALQGLSDQAWTYENLNAFIAKPKDFAPGTKMSFAGLKGVEDRAALIAYLRAQSDSPLPLPEVSADSGGMAEAAGEAVEQAGEAAGEAIAQATETAGATAEATMQAAGEAGGETAGGGLGAAIAAASAETGEGVARKCKACHDFSKDGKNKIGPALYGVVGRAIAGHEGYKYSDALAEKADQAWSYENLDAFLTDPKGWAPGTKMSFAGIKDGEDRAALLAYLRSQSDTPAPLP